MDKEQIKQQIEEEKEKFSSPNSMFGEGYLKGLEFVLSLFKEGE